jgi:hypothetical protein
MQPFLTTFAHTQEEPVLWRRCHAQEAQRAAHAVPGAWRHIPTLNTATSSSTTSHGQQQQHLWGGRIAACKGWCAPLILWLERLAAGVPKRVVDVAHSRCPATPEDVVGRS